MLIFQIPASRLMEFHSKYGSLLKASLAPHMRKRDKKKEKARAEAAAAKKREAYIDVDISGKKRGAGHRQRVSRAPVD
jgi:signal recognition particle subunit SRP14